jgi:hypothetical protein
MVTGGAQRAIPLMIMLGTIGFVVEHIKIGSLEWRGTLKADEAAPVVFSR